MKKNKHVLISGGSSGIGLALAKQFFAEGASVTIIARRKDVLLSAQHEIERQRVGPEQILDTISVDVTKFSDLSAALGKSLSNFDILINSAGIAYPGKFIDLDQKIFGEVMDVNYIGTVNLTKLIVPKMIKNKTGYIVNISSLAAVIGIYGYSAYAPSKYAVRGFSRCIRAELKSYGIDVSVVLPPDTDTPQLEFERTLLPEITHEINKKGGVLSPEKVAADIIKGMRKKKFTIIPGLEGKILYLLAPIFGRYFYHFAVKMEK
ncbi:MAG: SDR family oxidoreductase [Pelolinea sp.]|nr:SDR family oxidoreductase [Pelolinea sp.]